jgi:hypothetical protein
MALPVDCEQIIIAERDLVADRIRLPARFDMRTEVGTSRLRCRETAWRSPARRYRAISSMSSGERVCGITFLLRLRGRHASWKKVVITISHRELFALADTGTGTGTGRTTSRYDEEDGNDGSGEGEQGQEGGVGMGEMEKAEIVPWEEWGPRAARVISPPTFHWITAHAGQRWLS